MSTCDETNTGAAESRRTLQTKSSFSLAALVILSAALTGGCVPGSDATNDGEGWTYEDDGSERGDTFAPDTNSDATDTTDPDADPPPKRQPVTFRLTNGTDRTIRYQKTENCRTDAWLHYISDRMTNGSGCGVCSCETLEELGSCPVCAAAGACRPSSIGKLEPGDSVETTWSGNIWKGDEIDGKECQRAQVPPEGRTLVVRFCWGGTTGTEEGRLTDQTCETISFDYGQTSLEEHVIEVDEREPVETSFHLRNYSSRDVEVYPVGRCTPRSNRWVRLDDFDRDTSFPRVFDGCTTCDCETLESGGECAVCTAEPCPRPSPVTLESGETRTWTWSGRLYKERSVDGEQCSREFVPERGRKFQVHFCWLEPQQDGTRDRRCATKRMTYGDSDVATVIRSR